jgi:hypothetical protein
MRLAYKHKLNFEVAEARRRQKAREFFRPIQLDVMRKAQQDKFRKQLELAIRDNNQELTVALVRKGADFSVETEGGLTCVIRATLNGDRGFLRMLIEAGGNINAFSQKTGQVRCVSRSLRCIVVMWWHLIQTFFFSFFFLSFFFIFIFIFLKQTFI